jgi:hypothetical protein
MFSVTTFVRAVLLILLSLALTSCGGSKATRKENAAPEGVIVLKAVEPRVSKDELVRAAAIIRNRLVLLGISPATVRVQRGNRLRSFGR